MRHRIKQTYSVQKDVARDTSDRFCTNRQQLKSSHLLHSDKNICFYKSKLSGKGCFRKVQLACNFTKKELGSGPRPRMLISKGRLVVGRLIPLGLPIVSSLVLLLVLGMMINPVGIEGNTDKVYAVENEDPGIVPYTVPPDDGVSLTLNTTLPENETIEKEVSGGGAKYITVDFTVGAHNVDDYKVFVQADSTTLTGTSYQDAITSISTPTTATGMNSATKQWGYDVVAGANASMDSMTFKSIQTGVTTPAATVTGENGGKIVNHTQPYTLAFAANLDGAKADHYKSNITLSVAANAEEVAGIANLGFAGVNYMQDMTSLECYKARIGEEGRLIDRRDNKVYWVGRLPDGACWMTQNLDLDIPESGLTAGLTDISSDWTVSSTNVTPPSATLKAVSSSNWTTTSNGVVLSYDPGYNTIRYDENAGQSIITLVSSDLIYGKEVDGLTSTDARYLQGNYYTWGAALAGDAKNMSTQGTRVSYESICPKGWKLPAVGVYKASSPGTLYGLMTLVSSSTDQLKDLLSSPYYLVPSGHVSYGNISNLGSLGVYWSNALYDRSSGLDDNSFSLYIDTTNYLVNVDTYMMIEGLSVRCVVI